MIRPTRRPRVAFAAGMLLLAAPASAAAQSAAHDPPPLPSRHAFVDGVLRVRGHVIATRESLHPGGPVLAGFAGAADTAVRQRAGMLETARERRPEVATDELRTRMLAAYSGQAARRVPEAGPPRPPRRSQRTPSAFAGDSSAGTIAGYALIGLIAIGAFARSVGRAWCLRLCARLRKPDAHR